MKPKYWIKIKAVREFELGNIPYEKFAEILIKELKLLYSMVELQNHIEAWTNGLFPHAEGLVYQVHQSRAIARLSNSNAIQWPTLRDKLGIGTWFRQQFISCETGKLKPDQEAYEAVTEKLGIAPEKVVLFDDSQVNIEGAKKLGWSAYLVQGTIELASQLEKLHLI
jgi:HAD superfamily hydrolase (TIGR01509 family)